MLPWLGAMDGGSQTSNDLNSQATITFAVVINQGQLKLQPRQPITSSGIKTLVEIQLFRPDDPGESCQKSPIFLFVFLPFVSHKGCYLGRIDLIGS